MVYLIGFVLLCAFWSFLNDPLGMDSMTEDIYANMGLDKNGNPIEKNDE